MYCVLVWCTVWYDGITKQQWIRNNESTVSQWEIPLMTTDHCSEISKFNLLSIIIKISAPARIRTYIVRFAVRHVTIAPRTELKAPALKCCMYMYVSNAPLMP